MCCTCDESGKWHEEWCDAWGNELEDNATITSNTMARHLTT